MNEEIWKPVVGYEGLYEVSSYGRVRSLDRYDSRNCFRKGELMNFFYGCGYLKVVFCKNGIAKKYLVHRLVAQAFIPNPDNLPQVNHIDEDKSNNCVENLEWCDSKYNNNYGTLKERRRETLIKIGQYKTGLSEKDLGKREYNHQYYQKNKDKFKEYNKKYNSKYYQENKERISERQKEYYRKKKAGL